MKTIKDTDPKKTKKSTHSVMPMTPAEQKEFKEMMWRKKNEISSSAPVGGEAVDSVSVDDVSVGNRAIL